jgi:hypothetical protein
VNTKQLQVELDKLVAKRTYWRDMLNVVSAPQTKDLMAIFADRILAKKDSYTFRYDKCDPNDSNEISKCQEARELCNEILGELDVENCSKTIDECDKSIKAIGDDIKKIGTTATKPNLYTEQIKALKK